MRVPVGTPSFYLVADKSASEDSGLSRWNQCSGEGQVITVHHRINGRVGVVAATAQVNDNLRG